MPEQITFQAIPEGSAPPPDAAAKIRARAEKFGTAHMPIQTPKHPGPLRDELRKERLQKKDVVCTGFDLYSEEERAKQSKRASRFGTSMPAEGIAIAKLGSDEQAKKNRAMKFGVHYEEAERSGIDPKMVVEPRADASGEAEPRPDALHVYGVDLLTTADILSHFHAYGPSYVEWLNDSSCNVCFPDKFTVKRAIVQMGEALTDEEKEKNRSGANREPIELIHCCPNTLVDCKKVIGFEESETPQLWYRSKTAFTKSGVSVPLIFRIATTADTKNRKKQHKRRNLWKMPLRDALQVAKAHAEAGGAAAADEEMRETNNTRKQNGGGGKRGRIDDDGDVIMGGPGGQPRKKKQSAGKPGPAAQSNPHNAPGLYQYPGGHRGRGNSSFAPGKGVMHGGDGVAEGGYDDAGDQMHGLHDDSRTTDGAHSFFSRLRKREEGVDDKDRVGAQDLPQEELEWDEAGVVRVKEDKGAVKTEIMALYGDAAAHDEAQMQEG